MHPANPRTRLLLGLAICAAILVAFVWTMSRLHTDFDILNALPQTDDVTRDAREIMKNNPAMDRVVIDLGLRNDAIDKDRLVLAADLAEKSLMESGLFRSVGVSRFSRAMPELMSTITDNLPLMFTERDLEQWASQHLSRVDIFQAIYGAREQLLGLEGIGQSEWMEKDPLGMRFPVLSRMTGMASFKGIQFYRNHLLSGDGRHLLLVCEPSFPSTDTTFARKLNSVLEAISETLETQVQGGKGAVKILALGAYRYALDNEQIARRDATQAVILITAGIAFLLLLSFPRGWIGLLALIPAVAGLMLGLFVYCLFRSSISALALGFGGAMVSVTVDPAIAYLLFLDRTETTRASHASREVWSVGLFAVLTTAGAFCILLVSGFPLLAQVGLLSAAGILFSFLFLHLVFPLLLPGLKAARRPSIVPVEKILKRATASRGWTLFWAAVVLVLCGVPLAWPEFRADLSSMNTVSPETMEAESSMKAVWGDMTHSVYVMFEANGPEELHRMSDRLTGIWDEQLAGGLLDAGFTPSMVFPGPERARQNLEAWRRFWDPERVSRLRRDLADAAEQNGFSSGAFDPFLEQVQTPAYRELKIPETLYEFFGISRKDDGVDWVLLATATPGKQFDSMRFYQTHKGPHVRVFDPDYFSGHMALILSHTFVRMLLYVFAGVLFLIVVLFADIRLILLALAPLVFSLVCTLATMKLIGRPLDIPSLMLSVVIFGMGVDYGIIFVRSQQRFFSENHPSQGPIRTAVLLAASSTMIGMGALAFSRHAVLKSVGIVALLGIGYCVLGAFVLLPPLLSRLYKPRRSYPGGDIGRPGSPFHRKAALSRFDLLEPYARFFARLKMKTDPMFPRLADFVPSSGTVLDIGCGYGVPAAWLLALHPSLRFVGTDPDLEKVRVAARVIGSEGVVLQMAAPDLPSEPRDWDAVLLLDVAHYLSDEQLSELLANIGCRLVPQGLLVTRITVPADPARPWRRMKETILRKVSGHRYFLRSPEELSRRFAGHGFHVVASEDEGRDVWWFVAVPAPAGGAVP